MKVAVITGSVVGSNTKHAMRKVEELLGKRPEEMSITFLDLAQYDIRFSDGRNYFEYEGDTKFVTETIMESDVLLIGTPTFQASIPAPLKNIFDLLPVNAFRDKVVGIVTTAGSSKHYLVMEQQLKPILFYMKATVVQKYVFIEERDFLRTEIINDDIHFRLERLVDDVVDTWGATQIIREKKEALYDF